MKSDADWFQIFTTGKLLVTYKKTSDNEGYLYN